MKKTRNIQCFFVFKYLENYFIGKQLDFLKITEITEKDKLTKLFECKNSKSFINKLFVCDGFQHCPSSEDEQNCYFNKTQTFTCIKSRKKIDYKHVCNHFSDCPDGSDEIFCGKIFDILKRLTI